MNKKQIQPIYPPCYSENTLGCSGFRNTKNIVCLIVNDENNFIDNGIVEGSILFVNTKAIYKPDKINVYKYNEERQPQYKLSNGGEKDAKYFGRVVMAINQF